jgi:hypothetical protein
MLSSSWKMQCKEVSKFILENGIKMKRAGEVRDVTSSLSESRSMDAPKTGPRVSSSLLGGNWQYYNPEKGVCHPHTTLSSEELLHDTLQPF